MSISEILTLVAICVALFIGVASLLQTWNIQKSERKQRLLNEILDWAKDVINCTAGFNISPIPGADRNTMMITARSDTYFKHRAVNARSLYIEHIAATFGESVLSEVRAATLKLREFIQILESDLAALQRGGSENREAGEPCELELYNRCRELIVKISEIKIKENKGVLTMRRAEIAFGVAILAIGYNFLPVKAPEWLNWTAAILLLIIGSLIIFRALTTRPNNPQ